MRRADPWIVVPNWERFQHYGAARRLIWIRNYLALLRKDEYCALPLTERGLLHGIWLAYGERNGQLRRQDISQAISTRSTRELHIDSLLQAGFIDFADSKPLNLRSTNADARPREAPHENSTSAVRRRRRAEMWIRNGAAAEVPAAALAEVFRDEFKIHDPTLVEILVVQAQEHRLR